MTFTYWAAYYFLGDEVDTDLPLLLNLCLHGGNALVIFASRRVTSLPYYRASTLMENCKFAVGSCLFYNAVMALHKWRFGFEVYSFYGNLDWTMKMALNSFWILWMPLCSVALQRYYCSGSEIDIDSDTVSEACTEMTDFE